ncbi:MAG: cobalamin biosynthesis protein CobD [Nitrospirae bacterium]|nr:cobalamin biosynthesis protein CobD [Nitrospirota bacterium]
MVLAYFLDFAIGDPKWLPHPVRIMGRAITRIENFLRKILISITHHSSLITHHLFEKWAGILLVVIITGSTFSLFYIVNSVFLTLYFSLLTFYLSLLVLVYLISTMLATKGLIDSAHSVIKALKDRKIEDARKNLQHIVGRDTDSLDEKGVLRATIESLAENASDGIIAPLFYFAIGGLPLAMTYKAINTMDSMVGYKNERYRHFGWASARLDDIANYIPARITGILIVISSAILFRSLFTVHRSLKILFRDGRKHPSLNSGVPEAAMAGALGIRLGGPSTYGGMVVNKPYIGIDKSEVSPESPESSSGSGQELLLSTSETAISVVKLTSVLGLGLAIIFQYVRIMV